jgi:uncharacterized protein
MRFDPFESRTCRDIRNTLGHEFAKALLTGDPGSFNAAADAFESESLPPRVSDYIQSRSAFLKLVLTETQACPAGLDPFFWTAAILWNHRLFFECHEWLETKWQTEGGENKPVLQALILASVAYEQLSYRRNAPAKTLAQKAARLLKEHGDRLPPPFDSGRLISKLMEPDFGKSNFPIMKTDGPSAGVHP